jgi:hypothetical protein
MAWYLVKHRDNFTVKFNRKGRGHIGNSGLDSSGSEQRPAAAFCENGNESSGSIKDVEFLMQVSDYHLSRRILPHGVCQLRALYKPIR